MIIALITVVIVVYLVGYIIAAALLTVHVSPPNNIDAGDVLFGMLCAFVWPVLPVFLAVFWLAKRLQPVI